MNIKNKVEIKDDIALIHVTRKGYDRYLIVDTGFLPVLSMKVQNRLNIDSGGYVQHKDNSGGKYEVFQIHREVANAFPWETIKHKNGNKLDCRRANLEYYVDGQKII